MEKTIIKPSFREVVGVTTINLDDIGLTFNAQRVGPMNFIGLRDTDYGNGFRMPTMSELVPLVYASLENQEYDSAKKVIQTLRNHWLMGNTGVLYTREGMYVQDNPEMIDGRISMNQETLEKRLDSHEENGIVFSKNKTIRFVPYGFKRESQTPLELSKNTGVIALVGGEENAEKLAKVSEHYKLNPYFWVLSNVESPQTRVVGLYSVDFDYELDVVADLFGCYDYWFSFGVSENYIS